MLATHEGFMRDALVLAREAGAAGDVPVGALIVRQGEIIARAGNRIERDRDPSAHAEMIVVREASRAVGDWRLLDCTLYVTLEPCAMCAGALVLSRIAQVVFGAWDQKAGMAGSVEDILRHPRLNHSPQVTGGVLQRECGKLLVEFFNSRRGTSSYARRPTAPGP
jgi:tRNA(adenine34) deaminase